MIWRRAKRVRVHLTDPSPQVTLPSLEGLLVSRRHHEYLLALPQLIASVDGEPVVPDARYVAVPKSRVAFYEVIR